MTFPYISQIKVNNCYTYKDFLVPSSELSEFKHIVLTGKNGSGKTTILNRIAFLITELNEGRNKEDVIARLKGAILNNKNHSLIPTWKQQIKEAEDIDLLHLGGTNHFFKEQPNAYIFSFFKALRKAELKPVSTVTREDEFLLNLNRQNKQNDADDFTGQFKQYLVNRKVSEAFDQMDSTSDEINRDKIKQNRLFFDQLTKTLQDIFGDKKLQLEFKKENFEFYLKLEDGREITFNQLADGFSAFLSILMNLLMRTDLIRKAKNDYSLEPEGIVLIDEPETHLHLSMQYEILPLINSLFPKIQLIVATHSPAVISSIKNAVVYDLTSKEEVEDSVLGSSFSELMIQHFGLANEYSPVARTIISEINSAVKAKDTNKLNSILEVNKNYLTPSLRLEIESQIIHIKARM